MIVPSMTYEEIVKAFRKDIEASENKIDSSSQVLQASHSNVLGTRFHFPRHTNMSQGRRIFFSLQSLQPKEAIGKILNSVLPEHFIPMKAYTEYIWEYSPQVIR